MADNDGLDEKIKTKNTYIQVEPVKEEGTFKVDEFRQDFVVSLQEDFWHNRKMIVKHLEEYEIRGKKLYFVKEENIVAVYDRD